MNTNQQCLLLERFVNHLETERSLATLTVRNYRTDLQSLLEYMKAYKIPGFNELDRNDLRSYLAWLVEIGYARSSVVRKLCSLRALLRWLFSENIIEKAP